MRFTRALDKVHRRGAAVRSTLHVKVSVPKETRPGERRVALVPEVAGKLVDAGFEVLVQAGAGAEAHLPDDAYPRRARRSSPRAGDVLAQGDVVLKVAAPEQRSSVRCAKARF